MLDKLTAMYYDNTACAEGKSFERNDELDKAQTEMSALIRLFCLRRKRNGFSKRKGQEYLF